MLTDQDMKTLFNAVRYVEQFGPIKAGDALDRRRLVGEDNAVGRLEADGLIEFIRLPIVGFVVTGAGVEALNAWRAS